MDYVTQTFTDKVNNDKLQNRMFIISDSAKVSPEQPYDRLKYKCVNIEDYDPATMANPQNIEMKDRDGNLIGMYVYESMRIPETVPIVNLIVSELGPVGARAKTSLTVDKDGYITQVALYKGLDKGLAQSEHCDTTEFENQTKVAAMGVLVNKLENVKTVLQSYADNRGVLEFSYWIDKAEKLLAGKDTETRIQTLQEYINLAEALAEYAQGKISADAVNATMRAVCAKNEAAQKRYDDTSGKSVFERGYYVLTGREYRDHEEQFIRYSQKEQMAENNLRILYQNYKEHGYVTPKERELFRDISGSKSASWDKDFLAFIAEIDEAKDSNNGDLSQFSFINSSFGSKYLMNMTDGIFRNSAIMTETKHGLN